MFAAQDRLFQEIKRQAPYGADLPDHIDEQTLLSELGFTSMHVLTLILTLQREHGLDMEKFVERGMPITIGDIVDVAKA